MTVVPFRPYHLELLASQGVQAAQISHVPASYASFERPAGTALTAFEGETVIACGGILTVGERGFAWAVLSSESGRHMLWLHRAVQRVLEMQRCRRIEATVEMGFSAGCRWAKLLGFKYEGKMRAYGDDGKSHLRYGWVK